MRVRPTHSTVAYLVPVVRGHGPPSLVFVDRERLVEAEFNDGLLEQCAILGLQIVIKPVVADGEGVASSPRRRGSAKDSNP